MKCKKKDCEEEATVKRSIYFLGCHHQYNNEPMPYCDEHGKVGRSLAGKTVGANQTCPQCSQESPAVLWSVEPEPESEPVIAVDASFSAGVHWGSAKTNKQYYNISYTTA